MVRCQAYQRPNTSAPFGQSTKDRAHLGQRALATEYVDAGRLLVKQRRYLSKNIHATRRKHFKYYPGENVTVRWSTSLAAAVSGRVKYTHDVTRDIIYVNVIPEPREELLRDDLYRYRTEHVEDLEHNKRLCFLRQKFLPHFPRELVNPPRGPPPCSDRVVGRVRSWNNAMVRDPLEIEPFPFALKGALLRRHLDKVNRRHRGLPETDKSFSVTDDLLKVQASDSSQK